MWNLYFRISLYLRIGITTDNHCFVIVCDRSMTIPRCFETSIFSPFIVLKFCYDVDVKWTFIASSNNESSIIWWGRYQNGELFLKHSRLIKTPIIKMANFFGVIKMANIFLLKWRTFSKLSKWRTFALSKWRTFFIKMANFFYKNFWSLFFNQ